MNLREALCNLSKQSVGDEQLLSERERTLLAAILRHAQQSGEGAGVSRGVETVLARATGEIMLQRASEALGRNVLLEIGAQRSSQQDAEPPSTDRIIRAAPSPPASGPKPPSPSGPRPPGPGGNIHRTMQTQHQAIALQDSPDLVRAECVVLDEFLAPDELEELMRYTLAREADFQISEVISPGVTGEVIDPEYRRSRVLTDLGKPVERILDRIQSALPRVLDKLGMRPFPITRVESQITASNHGDFFRHHCDNAEEEIASRQLTYVYFFHREPKVFEGGELRLHDAYAENGGWRSTGRYESVVPEQNQIVFFHSSLLHEITPVVCPSQAFADSRFTVNGWLHR